MWLLAFRTAAGHRLDNATLDGFKGLMRPSIEGYAGHLVSIVDPLSFALLAGAVVCLALVRGRPRLALVVIAVLAGANLTTHFLQPALATSRDYGAHAYAQVSAASWPSGHTTAVMSLVLCLVLVAPAWLRPLAGALGGLLVVAVVYCILALGLHLPSDVLAGFAVASAWTWLGVAGLLAADGRWPAGAGRGAAVRLGAALTPPLAAAALACGAAGAVVALRFQEAVAYAEAHTIFAAAAAGIGAVGLSLVVALAVALRRQ